MARDDEDQIRWLKRQAIQIASMLPENNAEAVRVLGYATDLLAGFLGQGEQSPPAETRKGADVIRLVPSREEA